MQANTDQIRFSGEDQKHFGHNLIPLVMAAKTSKLATSGDGSPAPMNRLKFLCSCGGKILPCPPDSRLKYVGGDNRVLAVPRSISFAELNRKILAMFHTDLVIKYQLAKATDLDVLISVAGDEDLKFMIDEYDQLEALSPSSPSTASSPRFRLYLFPSSAMAAPLTDAADMSPSSPRWKNSGKQSMYNTVSSFPTSSPTGCTLDGPASLLRQRTNSAAMAAYRGMHRVHSSPNLGGAGGGAIGSSAMHNNVIKHHHHQLHSHYNSAVGSGLWGVAGPAVRQETCGSCGCSCRCRSPAQRLQ